MVCYFHTNSRVSFQYNMTDVDEHHSPVHQPVFCRGRIWPYPPEGRCGDDFHDQTLQMENSTNNTHS
jgi:hypothetical protein